MMAAPPPKSAKAVLESALALAGAGRIDEAITLCRQGLEERPDDVNLVAVGGAILLKKGEYEAAREQLIRAIKLEPRFAKPHEDLGALYLATGHPELAVGSFEAATALAPHQAPAFFGLATALERSGRHREAEVARSRFLELSPGGRKLAEAARLRLAGELGCAERICGEILTKAPRDVHALRLLAGISSDRQRDTAAEGLLRRIISLRPDFVPAYTDLTHLFVERSRFHEAAELLEKAAATRSDDVGLHLALADTLSIVGRSAAALSAYEKVLALQPEHPQALLGCGHMFRIHGGREEAIAAYRRCTAASPETGDCWWYLASMPGVTLTPQERTSMRRKLEKIANGSDSWISMQFALARDCESKEDYESAWRHYEAGNCAKRRKVSYDPVELEVQHDARIRIFDEQLIARAANASHDRTMRPIFVTGLPRSGSTLVEQILASHSDVEGCGELSYITALTKTMFGSDRADHVRYPEAMCELSPEDCLALGEKYLQWSGAHRSDGTRFFTDKMPANFGHLGFIRLILPEAVFIDVRREPLDACVANYRQLFARGKNQSYDLAELGEYYLEYLRVMRHWNKVMPGRILTVCYEDVVADLEGQVRRLLAHCGLPFEESCLRFHESARPVNSASAEQVRQPIYESAVRYWKNYASKLGDLRSILASDAQVRIAGE
ncbi:MAG: sulfotransferase [Woeseia sp.]